VQIYKFVKHDKVGWSTHLAFVQIIK